MIPKLAALLPVEDVFQSLALPDRRLTLHRSYFDLYAPSFPANVLIRVAMVLCGGAGEYVLEALLLDPTGQVLAQDQSTFTASAMHTHLMTLRGVLDLAGEYRLVGKIEDEIVADLPLIISTVESTK